MGHSVKINGDVLQNRILCHSFTSVFVWNVPCKLRKPQRFSAAKTNLKSFAIAYIFLNKKEKPTKNNLVLKFYLTKSKAF